MGRRRLRPAPAGRKRRAAALNAFETTLPRLRCPLCAGGFELTGRTLGCAAGHRFDLARQGYVNLAVGSKVTGDTAAMVAAREEFLGAGHYAPIASALADHAATGGPEFVVDVGGGTGYYLAHVLERTGGSGVVVEVSAAALRRAARAHPRVAAVGADVWRGLPFANGCADLVTTVFAPRSVTEVRRILRPGGRWVIVTPLPEHLGEVRGVLGMVGVEERKAERLHADLDGFVDPTEQELRVRRDFGRDALRALVLMGPSAHHVDAAALEERLAGLPDVVAVTVAVRLTAVTNPA